MEMCLRLRGRLRENVGVKGVSYGEFEDGDA